MQETGDRALVGECALPLSGIRGKNGLARDMTHPYCCKRQALKGEFAKAPNPTNVQTWRILPFAWVEIMADSILRFVAIKFNNNMKRKRPTSAPPIIPPKVVQKMGWYGTNLPGRKKVEYTHHGIIGFVSHHSLPKLIIPERY